MIHILSPEVANRIAAGEVVERPASVVRELIDNAVDAGATRIDIEVEDGGIALLRVADNGGGMSRQDAVLSVKRHATSKIQSSDDLAHITTKGFRGEALAAISSVAHFEIRTRRPGDEFGTLVQIEGGKELAPREVGTPAGTVVTIRDLFYNVPARRKFLKKPPTELSQILSTITWNALAQERVHFTFTNNGRRSLDYPQVGNRPERIQQIFGKEILADLIPVQHDTPMVSITGFISRPTLTRNNAQNIFFFVNDRFIKDRLLHTAMMNGYRSLIPHGRYPVVFLFYEIDPAEIDINVHPTKQEIKFSREDAIFGATYRAIRQAWDTREDNNEPLLPNADEVEPVPVANPAKQPVQPTLGYHDAEPERRAPISFPPRNETMMNTPPIRTEPDMRPAAKEWMPVNASQTPTKETPVISFPPTPAKPQTVPANSFASQPSTAPERIMTLNRKPLEPDEPQSPSPFVPVSIQDSANALRDLLTAEKKPEEIFSVQSLEGAGSLTVLGQLMNNYILAESAEGLYIIDQHAAHERLKFEEFLLSTQRAPLASQTMLFPITVDLAPEEIAVLEGNVELLGQFGFEVEPFGARTFVIRSIPSSLDIESAEEFIRDMLSEIKMEGSTQEKRDRMLHTMACRAAVKFGDPLTQDEMKAILRGLENIPRRNVCPHGRPSILFVSDTTLRKLFKRMGF